MPVFCRVFLHTGSGGIAGVSAESRAQVSLAGPLAGWISAVICLLLWWATGNGFWGALARAGAWLNVLNLIPVWVLDGGKAAEIISKAGRLLLVTTSLALWFTLRESVLARCGRGHIPGVCARYSGTS